MLHKLESVVNWSTVMSIYNIYTQSLKETYYVPPCDRFQLYTHGLVPTILHLFLLTNFKTKSNSEA